MGAFEPAPDFQRLRTVLLRQGEPDRLPQYELFVDREAQSALLGQPVTSHTDTIAFYHRFGYDYVPAWPDMSAFAVPTRDTEDTAAIKRASGRSWAEEDRGPITNWQQFEAFQWVNPGEVTYHNISEMGRRLPSGMKLIGQLGGIFEQLVALMGYTTLCYALVDEPDLVQAILDQVGALYRVVYERLAEMPVVGAVVISDDLGFKTQTLISPEALRRYIFPWHREFAVIAHAHDKPVIIHSCGYLDQVMDDLVDDVRIDARHSYEEVILPVTEAKRRYGDRVAILGGIDMDRLCRLEEPELRRYVAGVIEANAPGGGWALGSGNTIANYVPLNNYLAMLDEGRKWRYR